jgi:hypothetical protein
VIRAQGARAIVLAVDGAAERYLVAQTTGGGTVAWCSYHLLDGLLQRGAVVIMRTDDVRTVGLNGFEVRPRPRT